MCGSVAKKTKRAAEGIEKEDSGCRNATETEAAMAEQILQVEGLTARVEDKVILHEVGLTIKKGETHVLMGPNGAGKSTLGYVLTGNPKYSVTEDPTNNIYQPSPP